MKTLIQLKLLKIYINKFEDSGLATGAFMDLLSSTGYVVGHAETDVFGKSLFYSSRYSSAVHHPYGLEISYWQG